jgi:cyclopropane fatty-acyl-phospholipid synthase-like methyltransferase
MIEESRVSQSLPFPLSILARVIELRQGRVTSLHYGLFSGSSDSLAAAQERSTALVFEKLPPPPCSILEVGIGLGETLGRLVRAGYDAEGITPDAAQLAIACTRVGDLRIHAVPLEGFASLRRFDAVLFQESSQYIESQALFRQVRSVISPGGVVLVLDEFALRSVDEPGALHRLDLFLEAAASHGFREEERIDLSKSAAPTIDYFLGSIPKLRDTLLSDLSLDPARLDELLESGKGYRERYRNGDYGYLLLRFRSAAA